MLCRPRGRGSVPACSLTIGQFEQFGVLQKCLVRPACSAASVSLGQLVCEGGGGANLTDLVEYIRPLQYFLFISGVFGVGGKHTLGNKCYRGTMMESPPVDPVRRERQHLMLKLDLKNQNTSKPVLRPLK